MYSLKYCDLFKRTNDKYDISKIRLVCVFVKNEAFIVNREDEVFHVINNSFRRIDILCGKKVKEFVYGYSYIKKVFGYHVLALLTDGKLYGWGRNHFFQVSEIIMPSLHEPRRRQFNEKHYFLVHRSFYKYYEEIAEQYFPFMNTNSCFRAAFEPYYEFDKIACGQRHCMALTKDNKLILWGDNEFGQMGNGYDLPSISSTEIDIITTEPVKTWTSLFDLVEFTTMSCGFILQFVQFRDKNTISNSRSIEKQVTPTTSHQQTNNTAIQDNKVRKLICGAFHSFVLFESGNLYGWGFNDFGQLGVVPAKNSFRPQLLFKEVIQVSTSGLHSLVLTKENNLNKLYAMGDNSYAQLGNADKKFYCVPIEIKLTSNTVDTVNSILYMSAEDIHFVNISTINGMSMGKDNNGQYYVWGFYGELLKPNVTDTEKTPNNSNKAESSSSSSISSSQRKVKKLGKTYENGQTIGIITNYQVNKPTKVNCKSFSEIVARRFSLTHYTIKDKEFNRQLQISEEIDDNHDFDNTRQTIEENEELIDPKLLTKVKEDVQGVYKNKKLAPEIQKRLEMYDLEIMYLRGRLDNTQKNNSVKFHFGDKIKSCLVDGLVIPSGSLSIDNSSVTGKSN